jgi:hypothetical protein
MYQGAQRKNEDFGRREQGFSGQNRQNQGQERMGRDNRAHSQNRQPRVSDNDFPAMHMQQRQQGQQNMDNRRMNNPIRSSQQQNMGQQFGQGRQQSDMRRQQAPFNTQKNMQDAQIVEDTKMNQPIEDMTMPTQDEPYSPQNNEEVPDDWLMPKVFKGSKNNN